MRIKKEINDFYDLSNCCNDDLEIVALLIILLNLKPTQKMINELISFKLTKYNDDINLILDNLTIRTIREDIKIREIKQDLELMKVIQE